jgi:hypothetical protein
MKKTILPLLLLLLTANAFAAGRELAPRGGSPTSYFVSTPQVAFAGERFLTVWIEDMGHIGRHVRGAFSDASGRRVTPAAFTILQPFGGNTLLQLVGTGDSYALFWKDALDNTLMTDIDANGHATRTITLAVPRYIQLEAAWNGSRFLVVMRQPGVAGFAVQGFLLSRSGEILRRGIPFDDEGYSFHVIPDGDGFAAATSGFHRVAAYRVSREGDVASYEIDQELNPGRSLVSTTENGGLLVVHAAGLALHASTVDTNGIVQSLGAITTSPIPLGLVHLRRVGDDHLITYFSLVEPDNGISTLTLHGDGTVTPAPERAVELAPGVYIGTAAAASASTTLIVYTLPGVFPPQLLQVATANDATATEPEFAAVARSRQSQPLLASAGGRVLAAWSDIQGQAAFVRTASLAPDGTPLTDAIVAPAYTAARELAWNGTESLIVETRNGELLATRVAFDGSPLDAQPLLLGQHDSTWSYLNAAVTWAGDRWVVAWQTYAGIFFATVRNGAVTQGRMLALGELAASDPALAFNGSTLLLVWNETDRSSCDVFPPCIIGQQVAYAARITPDGQLAGPKRVRIPFADDYSIATSGSEFVILGGTTATVVDAQASNVLASRSLFNWGATSDMTWDGSTYAVALRYLGASWHVSVTHLDRNLNVVGTPRGTVTLPPDDFVAPSIAGSLVGLQEGDAVNGARAVVYTEADLAPLPAPPAAPLNVRATPAGEGRYEITWDPSPGAELYRVFIFGPLGGYWSIFDIPATQPRSVIAQHPAARVIAFNAGGASELPPRRRSTRR